MADVDRRLTDSIGRVRRLPPPDTGERRDAIALGLAWLCPTVMGRGQARRALEIGREAVDLARNGGDIMALGLALGNVAILESFEGNLKGAEALAREAIELMHEPRALTRLRFLGPVPIALSTLSFVRGLRGDAVEAASLSEEAMRWARADGNPWVIGMTGMNAGRVAGMNGDLPRARATFELAKASFEQAGDTGFSRGMAAELGHILRRQGNREEARAQYRKSILWFEESGNRGAVAHQLECFGMLAVADGAAERAARLFGAGESIRKQADAQMLEYERAEYDAAQARLRAALDPVALERAWADGERLSIDQAVALALEEPHA